MYVYAADTWCDSCGEAIRRSLIAEGYGPEDVEDEYSYDSDHFPKGPYPLEATDSPDHCAAQGDCLEGIDLAETWGLPAGATLYGAEDRIIGACLSSGLTEHGVSYLREMLEDDRDRTPYQTALHALWQTLYADELA